MNFKEYWSAIILRNFPLVIVIGSRFNPSYRICQPVAMSDDQALTAELNPSDMVQDVLSSVSASDVFIGLVQREIEKSQVNFSARCRQVIHETSRGNVTHGHDVDYSPGQMRSTPSYFFKTADILGEGATSQVFLGRDKKSGEKVAVKAFSNVSYQRSIAVQEREFDVLLKMKHANIVKLHAIESDEITRQRLIIMELCDCSVLNMLNTSKYSYGFPEEQFLCVLKDVSAGMMYLQKQGIVHRDIKPGNIMRRLGVDREPTYKLADFGSARELQDDENFVSLYGTEEYLHPAIYQRALLKQPVVNPFTAKVDLWSIGVTLYHVATGMLPFRSYGGRKNRTTMYEITSTKVTGVISGVQKDSEHGPITWSTELPKDCRLSLGLKPLLTDMLAGLLECNTDKMWSFAKYFQTSKSILRMRVIEVLNVTTSQLLKIYIEPNASYAKFQEHLVMQSQIPADQQSMLYDDQLFHPDATVNCGSYPKTSEQCPILMVPRLFDGSGSPVPSRTPLMPLVNSDCSLENDYQCARMCAAVTYRYQVELESLHTLNALNDTVVKAVSSITTQHMHQLTVRLGEVTALKESVEGDLKCHEKTLGTIASLLDAYLLVFNGSREEGEHIRRALKEVQVDIQEMRDAQEMMVTKWNASFELLQQLEIVTTGTNGINTWLKGSGCQPEDKCRERLAVFQEDLEEIMIQYRKYRKVKKLSCNEEQLHKMEKQRLKDKSSLATSLIHEHCTARWREAHSELMNWFSKIAPVEMNIHNLDDQLVQLVAAYPKLSLEIQSKSKIWDLKITDNTERLKKPQSPKPFPLATDAKEPFKICYPSTMEGHFKTGSVLGSTSPADGPQDMMIAVPRSFKKEVVANNQVDAQYTREELELGRKLMTGMRHLPLGMPDKQDANLPTHKSI